MYLADIFRSIFQNFSYLIKDIAEKVLKDFTEIFVSITKAVKNLTPLITLTKSTFFAKLYNPLVPKPF